MATLFYPRRCDTLSSVDSSEPYDGSSTLSSSVSPYFTAATRPVVSTHRATSRNYPQQHTGTLAHGTTRHLWQTAAAVPREVESLADQRQHQQLRQQQQQQLQLQQQQEQRLQQQQQQQQQQYYQHYGSGPEPPIGYPYHREHERRQKHAEPDLEKSQESDTYRRQKRNAEDNRKSSITSGGHQVQKLERHVDLDFPLLSFDEHGGVGPNETSSSQSAQSTLTTYGDSRLSSRRSSQTTLTQLPEDAATLKTELAEELASLKSIQGSGLGNSSSGRNTNGSTTTDLEANTAELQLPKLAAQTISVLRELETLCGLTEEFRCDAEQNLDRSNELLNELETKIKPYFIRLDEEIGSFEAIIRQNLDVCKITDTKISWLLEYHGYMQGFRRLLQSFIDEVFDRIESVLRVRLRGGGGAAIEVNLKKGIIRFIQNAQTKLNEINKIVHSHL